MAKLSQSTIENLKYYVYLLIDPRTAKPFYVGKGVGNRINHHLMDAESENTIEKEKIRTIRDIRKSGDEVGLKILRHGLTEKEAFEIECALIDFIGMKNLTNIVSGHYSAERGMMTLEDIEIKYQAQDAVFSEPVMLININKLYHPDMSADELYAATRQHWKVSLTRVKDFSLVCAVFLGIVREIYTVSEWVKSPSPHDGRAYFTGTVAPDEIRSKYLNRSVKNYWKKGSQNPIKYIG